MNTCDCIVELTQLTEREVFPEDSIRVDSSYMEQD